MASVIVKSSGQSLMFPHSLSYTSCTRPEVYEDEGTPLRDSLIGPFGIPAIKK